ncbi:MAG: tetratricopeptide repeat protein [Proteobacteria bacterium]|nr:tetratricopeptide repeat protein [Pseudomonadota bacterium]
MAVLDLQEQEQLDTLKAWWKDNGNWVVWVVLAVTISIAGVRGWQYYHNKQTADAATLYQQFVEQLASNDAKRVNDAAAAVMDKYSGTPYAARAALIAAQVNEAGHEALRAKTQLQWVIEHASEDGLKSVASLRMASMLLDEKDYAGALKLLDTKHAASFDALCADLKGDVLNAQGKPAEARAAYKLAFDKLDEKSTYRNLVQMKLDAFGAEK